MKTNEEIAAGLKAITDRIRAEAEKKPGRPYMPVPTTDAVPPQSHHDVDQDEEGEP